MLLVNLFAYNTGSRNKEENNLTTMKIAVCLPVTSQSLTHGARMVCQEFLNTLAEAEREAEIELIAPEGFASVPESFSRMELPGSESEWSALRLEQFELPRLIRASGADILLMLYQAAPLKVSVPVVLFEAVGQPEPMRGFGGRLLRATRAAGVQGVRQHVIYSDQDPTASSRSEMRPINPWVHPTFRALSNTEDRQIISKYGLPYSYVIAHGISPADVPAILASWTWVDGSVGDTVPLVVIASAGSESQTWERGIKRMNLGHSVSLLTGVKFEELAALYRRAEVMLHGGRVVEHQLLRWAMACGIPVTGFDVPDAVNTLGSAGYLVRPGDSRALGAACLTVIVEPEVKDRLHKEGLLRTSAFHAKTNPAEIMSDLIDDLVG